MRRVEACSVALGTSPDTLMENAGAAIAKHLLAHVDDTATIVVLVGSGNNGSDGLVAARLLAQQGRQVNCCIVLSRAHPDPKRTAAEDAGVVITEVSGSGTVLPQGLQELTIGNRVVLESVLGVGATRPIEGNLARIMQLFRDSRLPVYAVDVPIGVHSNSGECDPNGLPATETLALGFPKLGLLVNPVNSYIGKIRVLDIGIPAKATKGLKTETLTAALARSLVPTRSENAHKGDNGRVLIVGGSDRYVGALTLSVAATLRSGVGLVECVSPQTEHAFATGIINEAICTPLPQDRYGKLMPSDAALVFAKSAQACNAFLMGPGMGQSPETFNFMQQVLIGLPEIPAMVLDADGLNFLAHCYTWQQGLLRNAILTPHAGEMSRLLHCSVQSVQQNRPEACCAAAKRYGCLVVLKGPATIIATSDGRMRISPWANSGMATAGTGDVLAGFTAGLLAQMPDDPYSAASLAVYLHGLAGQMARSAKGAHAMKAGDLIEHLPEAFRDIA